MAERIEISTVKITELKKSGNHPFKGDWTGQIVLDGDTIHFSTDERMQEGKEYRVVLERTEPIPGEQIIEIHKIIEDEKQFT